MPERDWEGAREPLWLCSDVTMLGWEGGSGTNREGGGLAVAEVLAKSWLMWFCMELSPEQAVARAEGRSLERSSLPSDHIVFNSQRCRSCWLPAALCPTET